MTRGTGVMSGLEILDAGLGVSLQDLGRRGWKRFGVPPGGAMDRYAAVMANRLVGNPGESVVLEVLFQGARFRALSDMRVALTGSAVAEAGAGAWRAFGLRAGEVLTLRPSGVGVWSYLAVAGGWIGARWFGSVSVFPRGGMGRVLAAGDRVASAAGSALPWVAGVAGRWLRASEVLDYRTPPEIPVWAGPQWDGFAPRVREAFFAGSWTVSARSDRTGYRLEGMRLESTAPAIASEPVLAGTIQVPPDGQPIITQRDGPTVGGYPKLGLVDPGHLSWVAQHRPGQSIRFVAAGPEAIP